MLKALKNSLFSLIYPQECRVCSCQVESHSDGAACHKCWTATRIFTGAEMLCCKCGAYLGDKTGASHASCHNCNEHFYDSAAALGVYERALSAAILDLKRVPFIPRRLRIQIDQAAAATVLTETDIIIPIPLSRKRQLERGYNQAEIIAACYSRTSRIPMDRHSLVRKLHTPIHRVAMDQKAREQSVANAFEVMRPRLVERKNILLIDDIFTSGATASYAAKALKKKGAARVTIFTLARSVMR